MFTLRNKGKKQSGFTLMELLIVIAILGLLLGLIAPRLGGITAGTADNVCDTNNKGIRGMTALFLETNGSLPGNLTNMVAFDGTDNALPTTQDSTIDGEEVLSAAFTSRIFPGLYTISQAEANDLRAMGISDIIQLSADDAGTTRAMFPGNIDTGSQVMMVGIENTGAAADATTGGAGFALVDLNDAAYGDADPGAARTMLTTGAAIGNPTWIGRIVMAVSEKCDLVTSGLITASALCPTAVLNADKFTHDEFFIILPRLATTAQYMETATIVTAGLEYEAEPVDGDPTTGELLVADDNDAFHAGQEAWQFEVACPEGHKWPAADHENWIVQ